MFATTDRMATCSKRATWCAGVLLALSSVAIARLTAAELEPKTVQGYERYVAVAKQAFLVRPVRDGDVSAPPWLLPRSVTSSAPGSLSARGEITEVPGGLVHHWAGTIFIPGVDLSHVLSVAQSYDDYASMYGPVVSSRLLARDDNVFRVLARLKENAGILSAVLDVWTVVTYERSDRCAVSVGTALDIRQVRNPGQSNEEHLPAGRDSGYLWRANTFTRFVEYDGGVYVELETVGLSRRFPPLFGWIIEPIARRLGRASIERTLTEFRSAVLANSPRPVS
jgi:hypothetical protein